MMAPHEQDREDLMREAAAPVRRVQLCSHGDTTSVVIGFRLDDSCGGGKLMMPLLGDTTRDRFFCLPRVDWTRQKSVVEGRLEHLPTAKLAVVSHCGQTGIEFPSLTG